jgi:hypothetical protein
LRLLRGLLDRLPRRAARSAWGGRHASSASPLATADSALRALDASVRPAAAGAAPLSAPTRGSAPAAGVEAPSTGLLDLVVRSLARYKRGVAARALPLAGDVWDAAFRGAGPHRAEVEEHLRFLRFVACSSSLALTLPLLRALALELVDRAACAEERDCFYAWLASLAPGSAQRRGAVAEPITDETAESVFEHILCRTVAASGAVGAVGASLAHYEAFEVYMRWCNLVRAAVDDDQPPFVAAAVSSRRASAQRRRHAASRAAIADIRAHTFSTLVDPRRRAEGEFLLFTVTVYANLAHSLTRSP